MVDPYFAAVYIGGMVCIVTIAVRRRLRVRRGQPADPPPVTTLGLGLRPAAKRDVSLSQHQGAANLNRS